VGREEVLPQRVRQSDLPQSWLPCWQPGSVAAVALVPPAVWERGASTFGSRGSRSPIYSAVLDGKLYALSAKSPHQCRTKSPTPGLEPQRSASTLR
jgi:hypothetical protein